jgi:UDP-N-acetylmuramate dehydrogenase
MQNYSLKFKKNILLKNYTTFKIGGPAKYFFEAKSKEDLIEAIKFTRSKGLAFFVLGGGSNLLVADGGFNGLVIKIQNSKFKIQNSKILAKAGTSLVELVKVLAERGLTGLEWAVGIPGTVGGAIRGNTGAFGKAISSSIELVKVYDSVKNKSIIFSKKKCKFSYKNSIFKENKNLIVLSAVLKLKEGNKKEIQEKMKEYLNYRLENHPINFPSIGSIFENPRIKAILILGGQKLLRKYPELKEFNKKGQIPAGWLIEKCGLKGKKVGDAQISERHANFIVNLGRASSMDVLKLINLAKRQVKKKFGIRLEEEIFYLE